MKHRVLGPLRSRRPFVFVGLCGLLAFAPFALAACGAAETTLTESRPNTTSSATETSTTTTTEAYHSSTTSAAWAADSSKGMEAALQLGDAVISYLSERDDLAAVQGLVAPSAQEGLAQMLSLLAQPTDCKVTVVAGSGSSNVVDVGLLFADGWSQQPDYSLTIVVDPDKTTITAVTPATSPDVSDFVKSTLTTATGGATTGSSRAVIQGQPEPRIDYMSYDYSYYTAEAIALATVVEVLPLRRNPLAAGAGNPGGPNEHQPIVYMGYVLQVEKAYGPKGIPERITAYALGNGTVELDGTTYEVREQFPLDATPGDRLFVPLMKVAYFGTPELGQDEYWVQANWAVYAVDDNGICTRAAGADIDPEMGSEFPLSALENAVLEQGKQPSVVG